MRDGPGRGSPSLLRAGALVSALTLAGRVLGFVRTAASAAVLGAGGSADAFFLAFRLFGLLRAGLAAGGLRSALVPLFSRRLETGGREAARRFGDDAFASVLVAGAAAGALALPAMPWLVRAAAPGLEGEPEQLDLAAELGRIMLACLVLGGPALVLCAVLNAVQRFAAAASLAVLFNVSALAGLFALGPWLGSPAHGLAVGVAAAGAAQLAVAAAACRRAGFGVRLGAPRFACGVRRLFGRAAPAAVGAGAMQATLLVDLGVATLLAPGAVSHLDYAARVSGLAPALAGGAAATVLLPALSRAGGDGASARLNRTLEVVLVLSVPGAVSLVLIAGPLAAALFQHGAFTAADTAATAQAIAGYAPGLPAWVSSATLSAALFSRGDTATPMAAALGAVAVNLGLSLALMGPLGHGGVALATAASAWLQAAALFATLLRRGAFAPDRRLGARLVAVAASSAVAGAVLWLAREALGDGASAAGRAAVLAALLAAGLTAYASCALASGAVRPRELAAAWRRE